MPINDINNSDFMGLLLKGLEHIPCGLLVFDGKMDLVYSNNFFSRLVFNESDVNNEILSMIKDELERFVASGKTDEIFEKSLLHRLFLEISFNKIFTSPDEAGSPGVMALIRNITEYKKADMLKSDFIYLVSHELKTPLTAISGPVSILLSKAAGVINENQTKFLQVIKKNADRLARLLGNLTDLARVESGKIVLYKDKDDLVAALQNSLTEEAFLIKEKNIQVRLDISPDLPEVSFDKVKIEQVIINLLTNAIKFSDIGAEIVIEIKPGLRNQKNVLEFSVIDQGPGIAPENLTRIFEKFFQADTPQKVKGTGLGLTIARYIVEAHGGEIWATSPALGAGSKFTFTLPV